MRTVILILILSVFTQPAFSGDWTLADVKSFKVDGCSGSPDGNWGHCCYEHDFLYWVGGRFEERLYADKKLLSCMNHSAGPGHIYYDAVRSGGVHFWGKAWPNGNARQDLSESELEQIELERQLWISLNRPPSFNFVIFENIFFNEVTEKEKKLLRRKFRAFSETKGYKDFLRTYRNATGKNPDSLGF